MGIFDRFPYSSTHEMNLDFMLGKATEIAEDMQQVTAGMEQVQAGLSAISEKTEQATQAAAQAAQSASSIEGSVTAAEEAAEEAQMHNESAQTWANNAMTYKADCQRSATEAAASSSSAAQAATAAAASEDTVATYAQAANASAQSAANNNDSAHQYANQASASASNATFHSSNAQTAATNANTSATNAETAATNAQAAATRAATLKDDVETLVESLPEDFTDLNNTVNQLSDEIAEIKNVGVSSVSGIASYTESGGIVNPNGTWGGGSTSTSYKHVVIPCTGDFTFFKVTAKSNQTFNIAAVSEYVQHSNHNDPIQNQTQYWLHPVEVKAGETVEGIVPKDAHYLIVPSYKSAEIIEEIIITTIKKPAYIPETPIRMKIGAFNVRDFGTGTSEGCPAELVETNLAKWKTLVSGWFNSDFVHISEWRNKFDAANQISAYETIFKPFYPYMHEHLYDGVAIQCMMSKYPFVYTDLLKFGAVNRNEPMIISIIDGKSVVFVGWVQSSMDTVANRQTAYTNAVKMLGTFDIVIIGGDFNTEVGLSELSIFTDAGYTLGNGGYWGTINTWPAHNPATPNDNIAVKNAILNTFDVGSEYVSSDHKPVTAEIVFI